MDKKVFGFLKRFLKSFTRNQFFIPGAACIICTFKAVSWAIVTFYNAWYLEAKGAGTNSGMECKKSIY